MTSCGFKRLVCSPCGSSKCQKQASESIILLKCNKDIKAHLRGLSTYDSELKNEAILILARTGKCNNWGLQQLYRLLFSVVFPFIYFNVFVFLGIFDVDESHLHLTICPRHRDEYGIRWLTNKKKCSCPTNWAPRKTTQRRGDRGITLQQSRLLYDYTSTVVPVASRK